VFENRGTGYALAAPALAVIIIGFLLPVVVLLADGFRPSGTWTLAAFVDFFRNDLYRAVFWRTLRLGLSVTIVSAVLGYAAALTIVAARDTARDRLVALLVLPLMVSPIARTYAWIIILGRFGLVNAVVVGLGLSPEPLRLLFTETAVFIGLLQLFFPMMVLPLIGALENLPADVVPAARVLGASWFTVFWKVILPLTREGLVVGGTLVFTGSLTAYITPAILGGSKVLMLETLLYQRVNIAGDVPSAAVIATILIVMCVGANVALRRLATRRSAGGVA